MTDRPRHLLAACLLIVGAFEAAMSFSIDQPLAAIAFAVPMLISGVVLTRKMNLAAALIGTLLLLVDGAGVPFYGKNDWLDWVIQLCFAAVCLTGVTACIVSLRRHRSAARIHNQPPRTVTTSG